MKTQRIPWHVITWRGSALVLVVMLAPLLAALALWSDGDLTTASQARSLLVGTATLAAGALLYLHWRMTSLRTTGWLALLLGVAAVAQLALGALALTGPESAETQGGGSSAFGVVFLLGAVLLVASAAAVLHQAIEEQKQEVQELRLQLGAVEVGLREDQARLHEINSTVAGIASAQKMMDDGLTRDRSEALAAMMKAEIERLQRLVADRMPTRNRSVDLDDVIGQIVLSHLARGRVVVWAPSGLRAMGRADDIAEVVNVLLENAAVHGGPDAVSVAVSRDPDGRGVTVTVSDQGPGIPPELRERLFDWGVSRPDSPGHGIGLHVAADLAHELGGGLELLPTAVGASFAVHLPDVPQEVSADDRVARAS